MKKIIKWFKTNFKKEKVHGMRIIRNKAIPFQGYKAINLFGILFVKNNAKIDDVTLNHEAIHSKQIEEVMFSLAIPFVVLSYFVSWWLMLVWIFSYYIWYVVEWLIRLPKGNAYRNISFEREAYANQSDERYIARRKRYSFIKYIK